MARRRRSRGITPRVVWGTFVFIGLIFLTDPLPRSIGWLKFRLGVVAVGWAIGTYIIPLAAKIYALLWADRRWGSGRAERHAAKATGGRRRFHGLILRKSVPLAGRNMRANLNMNGWTSTSLQSGRVTYNTQRGGRIDLPGPFAIPFGGTPPQSRAQRAARNEIPVRDRRAIWESIPGKPADWEVTWTYGPPIVRRPKTGTSSVEEFVTEGPGGTTITHKKLRHAITAVCPPVVVDEDGNEVLVGADPDQTPPDGTRIPDWEQAGAEYVQRPYPWEAGMSPADRNNVESALRRMDDTRRRRRH